MNLVDSLPYSRRSNGMEHCRKNTFASPDNLSRKPFRANKLHDALQWITPFAHLGTWGMVCVINQFAQWRGRAVCGAVCCRAAPPGRASRLRPAGDPVLDELLLVGRQLRL